MCGGDLGVDWEADHILPWSKGGQTTLDNAQALCRACNRKKGAAVVSTHNLRKWQIEAVNKTLSAFSDPERNSRAFLAVATPGAGKTRYAATVAGRLFQANACRRVIVVVPTRAVMDGWKDTMAKAGIQLDPTWKGDRTLTRDFHGVIATYQGVLQDNAASFAALAADSNTLLIADEVHHGGEDGAWGDALKRIAQASRHRLFLTGTPIRSDNRAIPFVAYDDRIEDGKRVSVVVADYAYEYADALDDGVVRPVMFDLEDSGVDFEIERDGVISRIYSPSLQEQLSPSEEPARLKAAVDPDHELMRKMIARANDRVTEARANGFGDEAGIITCMGIPSAIDTAKVVRQITGEDPVIVHAEQEDAQQKIAAFRKGRQRWIVSVKMISEGVDIPRLLVGVLATNVTAELFFKQFVGRCVRVRPGEKNARAYIIAPKIDEFHANALAYQQAVRHHLREEAEREREPGPPRILSSVTTISTVPIGATFVYNGVNVPTYYQELARRLDPTAMPDAVASIAYVLYLHDLERGAVPPPTTASSSSYTPNETAAATRARRRKQRTEKVGIVIKMYERLFPDEARHGATINEHFKRVWGKPVADLEIAEIEQQIEVASRMIRKMDEHDHLSSLERRKMLGQLLRDLGSYRGLPTDRHPDDPRQSSFA
jgi:superfamily II DNA or RNA helicase